METQLEILTQKLENQIENMFNTLVKIQEIEATEWPTRHLSNYCKTALWMTWQSVLMRNLWDKFEWKELTIEQRSILVQEIWEVTMLHYLELYDFDSKEIAYNT